MRTATVFEPGTRQRTLQCVAIYCLLLLTTVNGWAQGWQISFGGNKEDQGRAILQTVDHGYIQAGFSESFGSDNDIDIYVVRTDVDGTLLWERIYDEGYREQAADIIDLNGEGFVLVGYIEAALGAHSQVYLLRIDNRGNQVWSRSYINNGDKQRANALQPTSDGGYIIIGSTENPNTGEDDVLLLKVDAEGKEVWRNTYGTTRDDRGIGVVETPTGYLFAVTFKGEQGPDNDFALYEVDKLGDLIGLKAYGMENENEEVNDLILTKNNEVVLVGTVGDFQRAFVARADLKGDTLWYREFDLSAFEDVLQSVIELEDGSLVSVGYSLPTELNTDIALLKLDANGSVIWSRLLGDAKETDFGEDIAATEDGGFIIAGFNAISAVVFINDLTLIKVDASGNYLSNNLAGRVYWSQDGCNPYAEGDVLMKNWLVRATSDERTYYGTTDAQGIYNIAVDTGRYTVTLLPLNDSWEVCNPVAFIANFTQPYDTTVYNFPVKAAVDCPLLEVNVSVPAIINCSDAVYTVAYCNLGTMTAEDAYVEIRLDEELTYLGSSAGNVEVRGDSLLIVSLGDIDPLVCGSFTVRTAVSCQGIAPGQAVLVSAHIFPDVYCQMPDPDWDMASIAVSGKCESGAIKFAIRNVGNDELERSLNYFVVEDQVMFLRGQIDVGLAPGAEQTYEVPEPNGKTYRIIAEQSPGHPGNSFPTVAVEGCTTSGGPYTTGQVTQFPEDDQDPFIDIEVQEVLSSGATLYMRGHPKGYQDSVITPTTDLEYTVFFTNTGTDTVDRVVIRDTLPSQLDLNSLVVGPASHPYEFALYDNGVLKITYDEIQLQPDGSTSTGSSQGYIKYRLSQKPNNPLGTILDNSAAVYFDYTAPRQTNRVRHEVGCVNFADNGCLLVSSTNTPSKEGVTIKVYPNPFLESATFNIEGCDCQEVSLTLYDALGRRIRTEQHQGPQFTFQRNGLAPALYLYELRSKGQLLNSGRLFVQ